MTICKLLLVFFCMLTAVHGVTDFLERVPALKQLVTEYVMVVDSVTQGCETNGTFDEEHRVTCGYQIYRGPTRVQLGRWYFYLQRDIPHVSIMLKLGIWSGVAYNTFLDLNGGICELNQALVDTTVRLMKIKILPGCVIKAGNYSIEGVNMDQYAHGHTSKMIPGRVKLYLQAYTPKGIIACFRSLVTLKPLKMQRQRSFRQHFRHAISLP